MNSYFRYIFTLMICLLCSQSVVLAQRITVSAPSHVAVGENFRVAYMVNTDEVEDFKSECEYILSKKKVVIFNKEVEGEYFSFFVNKDTPLESCLHSIKEYLEWLSDAKETLFSYYNEHCTEYTPQADDNWYDTLEVYRGRMNVWSTGVAAHISAGDIFTPDHSLEIDFDDKEITDIGWDG